MAAAQVSLTPHGTTLTENFDKRYERKTDADGRAGFTPTEGNYDPRRVMENSTGSEKRPRVPVPTGGRTAL